MKPFFLFQMFDNKRKNHLKSQVIISQLFSKGKVITKGPLRLVYFEIQPKCSNDLQFLISVPKKRFKLAVSRNRIRRVISEAYRLNSSPLRQSIQELDKQYALAIIYIDKKEVSFEIIEEKLQKLLSELVNKINFNESHQIKS